MNHDVELTILIPALNEEKTIEIVIKKAQKWLEKNKVNGEILVSNNNSTDKTKEIAIKNKTRVIDVPEIGYDLVIGNRFYHMEKGAMKWSHKYIGTPLLSYIIKKKYKINLKDVNCGLRGFKKNAINNLNLKCGGMEFASEMIIRAKQENLKIKEIPINFYKDKRNSKSHLNTIRDGLKHLKIIWN